MMTKGTVLVCFQAATAGQQGNNLGSDESQIVLLEYALVDLASNKVIGVQEYLVKPTEDVLVGNFLSTEILAESRVTEHAVKLSGIPLKQAINQFENYLMTLGLLETTEIRLVTDGQLAIRQVVHPEACKKGIPLKEYYNSFNDIRKDVALFYGSDSPFTSISDMLIYLDIPHSGESDFYAYEFRDMVNIVQRLLADGYKFKNVETVTLNLEPGICSRDEEVDPNCVVRARGLPWQSSDKDIAKFFRGLNVAKGGVALCLSPMGRRNGEALVRFTCQEHRDMALKRHKHHIDSRYIEVYRASGEDFVSVAGGCNTDAQAFLTKGAHVIIRMRGLPYECTAKQVIEFFEGGEFPCSVMDGEEGVLFVKKPDGRSTGDAFVLFKDETDSPKALSRHRESIGTRYIELFRSTTAEVQQVLNRTTEYFEKTQQATAAKIALQQQLNKVALASLPPFNQAKVALAAGMTAVAAGAVAASANQQPLCLPPPPLIQAPISIPPPQPPAAALQTQMAAAAQMAQFLPQHIITSGTRKDCIRLRGLPYEAQVEHILEFLGEHAKSILFQGVHMVYNSQGQPSGEAFIQMDSESASFLAAQGRHHRYMTFGKKQRYIEVFQCSGEDMSLVLSGGMPATPQLSPVTKGVISPGQQEFTTPDIVLPNGMILPGQIPTMPTVPTTAVPPPSPALWLNQDLVSAAAAASQPPPVFLVPKFNFPPSIPIQAPTLPQVSISQPVTLTPQPTFIHTFPMNTSMIPTTHSPQLKRTWNQAFLHTSVPPPPIASTTIPPPPPTQAAAAMPPPPKRPPLPPPSTSTFYTI